MKNNKKIIRRSLESFSLGDLEGPLEELVDNFQSLIKSFKERDYINLQLTYQGEELILPHKNDVFYDLTGERLETDREFGDRIEREKIQEEREERKKFNEYLKLKKRFEK